MSDWGMYMNCCIYVAVASRNQWPGLYYATVHGAALMRRVGTVHVLRRAGAHAV